MNLTHSYYVDLINFKQQPFTLINNCRKRLLTNWHVSSINMIYVQDDFIDRGTFNICELLGKYACSFFYGTPSQFSRINKASRQTFSF